MAVIRRAAALLVAALALGAAAVWWAARPAPLPDAALAGIEGDADAGAGVFWASGCASCHATAGATGDDRLVLAGGQRFETAFGTFVAPNISPDPDHGIGGWTLAEFANAMLRGVSPDGRHYYPAFPYTSYARMRLQAVADLKAFMDDLPIDATPNQPHDLPFPVNIRAGLGLWKRLYLNDAWVLDVAGDPVLERGRVLVEAMAHCAECHTPRGALGGLDTARWMQGAPNPSGRGRIPAITPEALGWSEAQIAGYLATGFTPAFDTAGGSMAAVVKSLAELPAEDREAIAAYMLALP